MYHKTKFKGSKLQKLGSLKESKYPPKKIFSPKEKISFTYQKKIQLFKQKTFAT